MTLRRLPIYKRFPHYYNGYRKVLNLSRVKSIKCAFRMLYRDLKQQRTIF